MTKRLSMENSFGIQAKIFLPMKKPAKQREEQGLGMGFWEPSLMPITTTET
jgi:hypothetical protein